MKSGTSQSAAFGASLQIVDHDVPTDPVALRKKRKQQVTAAVKSARDKVAKAKQHLAAAPRGKKERQRAHLKGAEQALAQAIAAQERIN